MIDSTLAPSYALLPEVLPTDLPGVARSLEL